jgi:hypothetical protein
MRSRTIRRAPNTVNENTVSIEAVRRHRQRGAQIAEAAVVLPVLFFILFEIVWLCLAFSSSSTLQRAAKARSYRRRASDLRLLWKYFSEQRANFQRRERNVAGRTSGLHQLGGEYPCIPVQHDSSAHLQDSYERPNL